MKSAIARISEWGVESGKRWIGFSQVPNYLRSRAGWERLYKSVKEFHGVHRITMHSRLIDSSVTVLVVMYWCVFDEGEREQE
jgi:hypothetical protein